MRSTAAIIKRIGKLQQGATRLFLCRFAWCCLVLLQAWQLITQNYVELRGDFDDQLDRNTHEKPHTRTHEELPRGCTWGRNALHKKMRAHRMHGHIDEALTGCSAIWAPA